MDVNVRDIPTLLQPGINLAFAKGIGKVVSQYQLICTFLNSDMASETFAWMGIMPMAKELLGEREILAVGQENYTITQKTWTNGTSFKREVIEDEQYGLINLAIEDLASQAMRTKDYVAFSALVGGTSGLCFDGQPFFSKTHKYTSKGATKVEQSNLNNLAFNEENLQSTITAMEEYVSANGDTLNLMPDTLVVPSALRWAAMKLLQSDYDPGKGDEAGFGKNIMKGILNLIVSPYIKDRDSWYLLCLDQTIKPLIFVERMPIEVTSQGILSDDGFLRDVIKYGTRARYNVGYGMWQLAFANIPD